MLKNLVEILKNDRRKLVFTEGTDPRILEAAARLLKDDILIPVLVGDSRQAVEDAAKAGGFDISGAEIICPAGYERFEEMVDTMTELRKGKMTREECETALKKGNYFGTMLVKLGAADGLLGGATYSTADTVRPALQIVKTKPGSKIVSSCFIMTKETPEGRDTLAMGDCAINLFPTSEELVEIATETAATAAKFGITPRVAMLSYSTLGSGKGESVDNVRAAAATLKGMDLPFDVDGEFQFDAAVSETVAKTKAPDSKVAGKANCFVFPDINAGNIGYKIAQRLGGYDALGPIMQGLGAPINDLSRGCNADEVYMMAIITAGMK